MKNKVKIVFYCFKCRKYIAPINVLSSSHYSAMCPFCHGINSMIEKRKVNGKIMSLEDYFSNKDKYTSI